MSRLTRHLWPAVIAVVMVSKVGLAVDPPGNPAPAPQGTPPPTLRIVREADVTPAGAQCVRPELVAAGGTLFVAYMELGSPRTNRLLQLDADLKPVRVFTTAAGDGEPTDMRWVGAADGTLWCAFETVPGGERPTGAALHLVSYTVTPEGLKPGLPERRIASGAVLVPPWSIPAPGAEITNDPTPFLFGGSVVLGTRRFTQAVLPLRSFGPGGEQQSSFELDLSGVFPDRSLSVYSLVAIEGKPWLLAGAETSPRAPRPEADIYAVPLQPDLRGAAGVPVPLVATPAYETYVCGARTGAGRLVLVHSVNDFPSGRFEGHVRVFDTAKGFAPIGHALVMVTEGGLQLDGHLSIELLGDRIFVASYTGQGRLIVREYALAAP